ncbi:MAG: glycosyltransferase [Bdellovibrio sp.]
MAFIKPIRHLPVTILIPAYNEEKRIRDSLAILMDWNSKVQLDLQVLVVDDGSNDSTFKVAANCAAEFPSLSIRVIKQQVNSGRGRALELGILAARTDLVLWADADASTDWNEIIRFYDKIVFENFDLVIGSRYNQDSVTQGQPVLRKLSSFLARKLIRASTQLPYRDYVCGFKMIRKSKFVGLKMLGPTPSNFLWDLHLIFWAHKNNWKISELPIRWNHRSGSKVRWWRDSRELLTALRALTIAEPNNGNGIID